MQQYIAGKENHNHYVWERAYIRQTEAQKKINEGVIPNIQMGDVLANMSSNCSVLLKNIRSPHFLFRLINIHSAKSHTVMKIKSNIKSETPLWQSLVSHSNKTKRKKKKSVSCFVLLSAWLMNPLANDLKQQSSQGTGVFNDRQSASDRPCTSQHHRKLTNHCDTHRLRWFWTKALLCLNIANLVASLNMCKYWMLRPPSLVAHCCPVWLSVAVMQINKKKNSSKNKYFISWQCKRKSNRPHGSLCVGIFQIHIGLLIYIHLNSPDSPSTRTLNRNVFFFFLIGMSFHRKMRKAFFKFDSCSTKGMSDDWETSPTK